MLSRSISILVIVALLLLRPTGAQADPIQFIRDAEIENTLRLYAAPLFRQAGVDPDAVKINIVQDSHLNAFVAEGLNLFLYTGLIIRTETPSQLIGVIAHESGHIAGGHLVRGRDAIGKAETVGIVGMLLGLGMMAVAAKQSNGAYGHGDVFAGQNAANASNAGMATILAAQDAAIKTYFSFSRTIEGTADTAALTFLDNLHESARGFLEFMQTLEGEEMLMTVNQDPYVRTHPLTADRVEEIRHHVENSPWSDVPTPPEYDELHQRMRAKLIAFLEPPKHTLYKYKDSDPAIWARYARAIAYYRVPDLAHALPLIDALIAERPHDPYFHELKGQMLFENARVKDAVPEYKLAVANLPNNPLLLGELGQAEVEADDPKLLDDAKQNLMVATRVDPDEANSWLQLATIYGRENDETMVAASMAEYELRTGNNSAAAFHAEKALRSLKAGTPLALRMEDIRAQTAIRREESKN